MKDLFYNDTEYLKEDADGNFLFPKDWIQVFRFPFKAPKQQNESMVLQIFLEKESREDARRLGNLLFLLYNRPFALKRQMEDYLEELNLKPADGLDRLLDFALSEHFLNCFTFKEKEGETIPRDALKIYCLDHASRYVLGHFYKEEILYTWNRFRAYAGGLQVSRVLLLNDLYLALKKHDGGHVKDMASPITFYYNHKNLFFHGGFYVKNEKGTREYLIEVVREDDLPGFWRSKVTEEIAPFLTEGRGRDYTEPNWQHYFEREPALLILGDTLESLREAADLYERGTGKHLYRLCLISELSKGLASMTLYRYSMENGKVEATKSTALHLVM